MHLYKAKERREMNRKKRGSDKITKLNSDHLEFIKMLLDNEDLAEEVCLRSIVQQL